MSIKLQKNNSVTRQEFLDSLQSELVSIIKKTCKNVGTDIKLNSTYKSDWTKKFFCRAAKKVKNRIVTLSVKEESFTALQNKTKNVQITTVENHVKNFLQKIKLFDITRVPERKINASDIIYVISEIQNFFKQTIYTVTSFVDATSAYGYIIYDASLAKDHDFNTAPITQKTYPASGISYTENNLVDDLQSMLTTVAQNNIIFLEYQIDVEIET